MDRQDGLSAAHSQLDEAVRKVAFIGMKGTSPLGQSNEHDRAKIVQRHCQHAQRGEKERREQEVELNRLKAMVAQMRAEEIKSKVTFNKTKLSQVKKRVAELSKEIEVRQRQLELEGRYLGKSAKTDEKPRDVLKEVDELLSAKK